MCLCARQPENFLFTDESESAQLKMIDFGFAKDCSEQLRTPVFTPYYAGPLRRSIPDHTLGAHGRTPRYRPVLVFLSPL